MTKMKLFMIAMLIMLACPSSNAQTRKNTSKSKPNATIQDKIKEDTKDNVTLAPKKEEPKYKSLSDPLVVKYLREGFAKENKLYLMTNSDYASLSDYQKRDVLTKVAQEFAGYDVMLYTGGQQRELWISDGNTVKCLEKWNNDSLKIENYLPLELKRQGKTKVFYYVGGMLNSGNGSTSYSLNLRGGTYLYENLLDASVTLNLGGNRPKDGKSQFMGDVGVDSRAYLPFRINNVNLAPYAGAGVSWSFSPESFFELRLLAGGCWFVGPGSLDIGLQYGTKSDFAVTLGYTFRIPVKKKQK